MILKPKAISVILTLDTDLATLEQTLRVWPLFCLRYSDGCELIFVSVEDDYSIDNYIRDFMELNETTGIRMVHIPAGEVTDIQDAYNEGARFAQAKYLYFASASGYPKVDIFRFFSRQLDDNQIVLGGLEYIRSPFDYSIILRDARDYLPSYTGITVSDMPWSVMTLSNFVVPASLLEELNGFGSDFEDPLDNVREFAAKAKLLAGTRFVAEPDAVQFLVERGDISVRSSLIANDNNRYLEGHLEGYISE